MSLETPVPTGYVVEGQVGQIVARTVLVTLPTEVLVTLPDE